MLRVDDVERLYTSDEGRVIVHQYYRREVLGLPGALQV